MSSENSDTRTRILKAAWELLEGSQGAAVRMSDIAKGAGISRQAVYLHFNTRAELLIATTRYIDERKDVDQRRLVPSREAQTGIERLDAFIEAWGNYIPDIYGVARALLAVKDTDEAAAAAWQDRMSAVREGCESAVRALANDGALVSTYTIEDATDILWTVLSVRNWEHFTVDCGWTQAKYIHTLQGLAKRALVA